MISTLGIIPAAGKAERFGGVYKELLPVGHETLLERATFTLSECELTTVISKPEKVANHAETLSEYPSVAFMMQDDYEQSNGAWSAIHTALSVEAERYFYMMPDTYMPTNIFSEYPEDNFIIWTFKTDMALRFGCLSSGRISDKPDWTGTHTAWGALSWSNRVREMWLKHGSYETHTTAFNMAIKEFGYITKPLGYYYDIASWRDYQRLVRDVL